MGGLLVSGVRSADGTISFLRPIAHLMKWVAGLVHLWGVVEPLGWEIMVMLQIVREFYYSVLAVVLVCGWGRLYGG